MLCFHGQPPPVTFTMSTAPFRHPHDCSICIALLEGHVSRTACGHVFHHTCLVEWQNIKGEISCAICQQAVDMTALMQYPAYVSTLPKPGEDPAERERRVKRNAKRKARRERNKDKPRGNKHISKRDRVIARAGSMWSDEH